MILWTNDMYRYLSWMLFKEVFGMSEWTAKEAGRIQPFIDEAKTKLTPERIAIVENRARRLSNEYEQNLLHQLNKKYWKEIQSDEDYIPRHISFDSDIHETWMSAVRKKQTIKIKYDSISSGLSERLVNPYKTTIPYGIGYCHRRKEVRQFRFDRIIEIHMMNQHFKKPDGWEEDWRGKRNWN